MKKNSKVSEYQGSTSKLDPIDSVRQRPGMYVGDLEEPGAFHALLELVANAIDQFLKGEATLIKIQHDGLRISVYDDGGGFPFTRPEIIKTLTEFHDKATADDHAPHIHLELRGVGLYPINALSRRFELQTNYEDQTYTVRFERGRHISTEIGATLPFETGTQVTAELDSELFTCTRLHRDFVRKRFFETAHLFPGLSIELNEERFKTEGLLQLAELYNPDADYDGRKFLDIRRFGLVKSSERLRLNVALLGETEGSPIVRSWVNGTPTPLHGTHVRGVLLATRRHEWLPQTVLVSVVFNEVTYAGPTRDELATNWVCNEVEKLLSEPLKDLFSSEH